MTHEKPRLAYTLDEFCSAAGMARTAAYKAIATGALKTFKNGKRRMVSVRAAQEFIDRLESAGKVAA